MKTVVKAVSRQPDTLLSARVLGQAVELVGLMTALANRVAVLAFRAGHIASLKDRSQVVSEFEAAIQQYSEIAAALRSGDAKWRFTDADAEAIAPIIFEHSDIHKAIDGFTAQAYFVFANFVGPATPETEELLTLAKASTGALTDHLNGASKRLQTRLSELARVENEVVSAARTLTHDTLSQLNDVTRSIQMIAVNATIEAARAGDAGRGFSVIANEIRSLSAAAKDALDKAQDSLDRL